MTIQRDRSTRITPRPAAVGRPRNRRRHAPLLAERLEARALLAVSAQLVGGVLTIQCNANSDLATLAVSNASYTVGGTGLTSTTLAKSAVNAIRVIDSGSTPRTGQTLLVSGAGFIDDPLSVTGIEATTLGARITIGTGKGDVVFGGPVILPDGKSILVQNTVGKVSFQSTVNGACSLVVAAPGQLVEFGATVGNSRPLAALAIPQAGIVIGRSAITVDGRGTTANGITIGGGVNALLLDGAGSSVRRCTAAGIRIEASAPAGAWSRTISGFKIGESFLGVDFRYGTGQTATTVGFSNWTITNNTISGSTTHGIRLAGDGTGRSATANVTLAQNVLSGNKQDGIRVDGTPEGLLIRNNTLTNNGLLGSDAAIRFSDGLGVQRTSVTVDGNTIGGSSTTTLSPATGVVAKNLPGLRIVGNALANIDRGIALAGGFQRLDAAPVLAANTLTNVGTGIALAAATSVTADATNAITTAGTLGIQASGSCTGTVIGGLSITNARIGVGLGAAVGLKIDGVAVSDSALYGISASGLCTGSMVSASTFTSGDSYGIFLNGARGLTIAGATVSDTPTGILALGDCAGTKLTDPTVTGCSSGAYLNGNAGGITGLEITGGTWTGNTLALRAQGVCTGTTVSGGTFTGNNMAGISLGAATGLTISGATLSQSLHGVQATGTSTGTTLQNLTVTGTSVGVDFTGVQGLALKASTISANAYRGIRIEGDSTGTRVENCTIKANQVDGVWLDGAKGLAFLANAVTDNVGNGLIAMSPAAGATIAGSTFANNGDYGVSLSNVGGLKFIGGNVCSGNVGGGLLASADSTGTTIADSTFTGNTVGVSLQTWGLAFSGNQVTNNLLHGLYANYISTGTTITNSTFTGNDIGMALSRATGMTVSGNTLQNNVRWGLAAYTDCTNTKVSGNTITLNGKAGVVLSGVQGLTVNGGNLIESNTGNGVYVSGTCTGTKVAGNTIKANAKAGLSLAAAQGFTGTNNMITGNKEYGLYATGLSTGTSVTGNTISGSPTNVFVTATGGTFQKA